MIGIGVLVAYGVSVCIATGIIARRMMSHDGELDRDDLSDVTMLCLLAAVLAIYWPLVWPLDALAHRLVAERRNRDRAHV